MLKRRPFILPSIPVLRPSPPSGEEWLHQIKCYRMTRAPHPLTEVGPILTRLGVVLSHPGAFIAAFLYSPETLDWHACATIAALFMTLFIQRATHRDTQALHAKIDELLHVNRNARNSPTLVDDDEPEEIEERRQKERKIPRATEGE